MITCPICKSDCEGFDIGSTFYFLCQKCWMDAYLEIQRSKVAPLTPIEKLELLNKLDDSAYE